MKVFEGSFELVVTCWGAEDLWLWNGIYLGLIVGCLVFLGIKFEKLALFDVSASEV